MDEFSFMFFRINSDHLPNPPIVICDGIQTTEWFISSNRVLQPSLFRVHSDQQQDCHWCCHFSCVLTFRQPIRHHNPHLEGIININLPIPWVIIAPPPRDTRCAFSHHIFVLCGSHALDSEAHKNVGWRRFLKHHVAVLQDQVIIFHQSPLMYISYILINENPWDNKRGKWYFSFLHSFVWILV